MEERRLQNQAISELSVSDEMRMGSINLVNAPEPPVSEEQPVVQNEPSTNSYLFSKQGSTQAFERFHQLTKQVGITERRDWIYLALGVSAVIVAASTYLLWPSDRAKILETTQGYKVETPPSGQEHGYLNK